MGVVNLARASGVSVNDGIIASFRDITKDYKSGEVVVHALRGVSFDVYQGEILIILAIVYVPFMQRFIGTGSFEPKYWLFHLLWIPSLPLADAVRKAVQTQKEKRALQKQILAGKGETL